MTIQREKKKYPIILWLGAVLGALLVICSIFAILISGEIKGVKIKDNVTIEVTDGMTMKGVAKELKQSGVINFPFVFSEYSKRNDFDKHLKKGVVTITPKMSYKEILELLINAKPKTIKVVIPEGYTVDEISEAISQVVPKEEFLKALDEEYDYRFLEDLPKRQVKLEGYLFPATYDFPQDASARDIVSLMLDAFDNVFLDEYYEKARAMDMSVDEIVTLASIIERESNSDSDRKKISGVFHNRLSKNMRLQSCATVQYILGERKANLSTEDTKIDSPYNTYVNSGLPIGPICSPGKSCIEAALYPEETDALYFVLGADGKHVFSKTYEEHLKAKNASEK